MNSLNLLRRDPTRAKSSLNYKEREWLSFLLFLALLLLLDRASNMFPATRVIDGLSYLVAILGLACWAGMRPALGSSAVLVAYVWCIYRFPGLSHLGQKPANMWGSIISTAIVYPLFAIMGGVVNVILRRSGSREAVARAEALQEAHQRRVAEQELWASEEMRRVILDAAIDAIVGIAPDWTVSLWSPNAEKLLGWTRAEALGQPLSSTVAAPDFGETFGTDIVRHLESNPDDILTRPIETTLQTASGQTLVVEARIVDHNTDAGTMYLLFMHDITERKRDEKIIRDLNADLRELNTNLEHRVDERTKQLQEANEELLGFTYTVSHDLRAPLRSIVSNSRLARIEAGDNAESKTMDRLERVEGSALKMSLLIDNLLEHARVGRVRLSPASVDLSAMAARIAEQLSATLPGDVAIQPGIAAKGDPEMIEIVLVNLMDNAWKYIKPGETPEVEVGTSPDGAIFVRDHGVGFDMKYVEKIWEPFERLHTDREYPGTGIGLANSKRIIERHGGQIWTESAPGKGTTMFFTLGKMLANPEAPASLI